MAKRQTNRNRLTLLGFLHILVSELKPKDLGLSALFALVYIGFVAIIPNWKLSGFIFLGSFPLLAKLRTIFDLIFSLWTRQSNLDFWVLLLSSILVGLNIVLVGKTFKAIGRLDHIKLSVGGITLLSIVTTGCASCGLSILSLLGLSFSFSFLPFHGLELHVMSVFLLIFSLWYMATRLYEAKYCRIS